ncbi:MAG: TIGR03790 family protein [Nitrospirae bacterium]|nr:TIGR03790 family protein [Nitrospirota bacterium]
MAFLLIAGSLLAAPAICNAAVSPEDIIVVYNRKSAESRDVADYYASRRNIPGGNLTGIDVPDSESISRDSFNRRVLPPLREAVGRLRKSGRKPVILLVYGTPLRIDESAEDGNDDLKQLAERRVPEVSSLVTALTARLEELEGVAAQTGSSSDALAVIARAEKAVIGANGLLNGTKTSPRVSAEAGSIVFRLVGIGNIARNVIQQAGKKADELKGDNLVGWASALQTVSGNALFRGVTHYDASEKASAVRASYGLLGELRFWHDLSHPIEIASMTSASLDSELAASVAGAPNVPGGAPNGAGSPHRLGGWLANPFNAQFDRNPGIVFSREDTVMAARLDGPTPEIAKRLVDDAIWAEENGLDGKFYIDAKSGGNDENYDSHLLRLANLVREKGTMPVVIDTREALFAQDCCPDAALYVGWYSLGKYVDSFKWKRGAVGFHVASAEAQTLRDRSSTVWCKRMLEDGVAATLGPVNEPYLQAFPAPEIFFPLLLTGKLTLVEAYYRSAPFVSWRMTLIGDPLYAPFRKKPAISQ